MKESSSCTHKDDTISRHAAVDEANAWLLDCFKVQKQNRSCGLIRRLEDLPAAQPERANCKICHALQGLVDRFERILRDIRETQVDDSVCGMCEYDGAFVGQSGEWCNECPGFEKDDCFKLSDECRKRWLKEAIDGVEK